MTSLCSSETGNESCCVLVVIHTAVAMFNNDQLVQRWMSSSPVVLRDRWKQANGVSIRCCRRTQMKVKLSTDLQCDVRVTVERSVSQAQAGLSKDLIAHGTSNQPHGHLYRPPTVLLAIQAGVDLHHVHTAQLATLTQRLTYVVSFTVSGAAHRREVGGEIWVQEVCVWIVDVWGVVRTSVLH